jgi:hypothetical protein
LQAKQTAPPEPIAEHTTGTDSASFAAVAAAPPSDAAHANADTAVKVPARTVIKSKGAVELLGDVYREKGLAGWYQGLGAQIFKAVLCQGTSIHATCRSSERVVFEPGGIGRVADRIWMKREAEPLWKGPRDMIVRALMYRDPVCLEGSV